MTITRRGVAQVVIFSIITCGIYALYWLYVTAKELQAATGKATLSPGILLILGLFVWPAALAILAYDANNSLNMIRAQKGLPQVDNLVLWIILAVLISIVSVALIQNEINTVV